MAHNEQTSEKIGELAARLLHHPDPDVRRLAGSCLTQRPDNPPGAHAVYNAMAGRSILTEIGLAAGRIKPR